MAIRLPQDLPAHAVLTAEGATLIAPGAPGRPLRIALLNLMPDKVATETQLARLLAASPFDVEPVLLRPASYRPRNACAEHLRAFYRTWQEVRGTEIDGLIVTGAPVETLPFTAVAYWEELTAVLDWAAAELAGSLYICWAAQAALWHFHGVPKHDLTQKRFGVFAHRIVNRAPVLAGFAASFPMPVSRHSETRAHDLPAGVGLRVLARSPLAGPGLIEDRPRRALYMFNHLEYDRTTLCDEYRRDLRSGRSVPLPRGYFPGDNPTLPPHHGWRRVARLLFGNWLAGVAARCARRPRLSCLDAVAPTPGAPRAHAPATARLCP